MNDRPIPFGPSVSRRQAGQIIVGATLLGMPGLTVGQPNRQNRSSQTGRPGSPGTAPDTTSKEPKSILDGVIARDRTRDWILKPTIHIQSYQEDPARVPKDGSRTITIVPIEFKTAALVFPILKSTASSESVGDAESIVSDLTFDDRPLNVKPDFNESYHSMVRLGRWEMTDKKGRECELKLEIPLTCWQTKFDESIAAKATWPKDGRWGRVGQSTLAPQAMIDEPGTDNAEALKRLVGTWLGGKPPQSMTPLGLAKMLAGKCVETFQKTGSGELYSSMGRFAGLELQGPARTIELGRGSPHDIASVLLGLYRAVGLPSRLVIGYDQSDRKGENSGLVKRRKGGEDIRSWVEFCLFDAEAKKEFWVPVDVVEIRSRSSRPGPIDKPWKYFGTHDELDVVLPFAHHFIPPTTVNAYGYGFWGWLTMPQTPIAEQWLQFSAQTAPKRGGEPKQPAKKPS
ncbi:MAG: transglutaminase domain-containing protein [Phycisphaerales bacterium]|nr:transglutaminase domain-containing protein [Phycisphaerales bacterium]